MNTDMHGKAIQRIWFNGADGDKTITAETNKSDLPLMRLEFSATFHGDHEQFWVLEKVGDVETARHNCRAIASIEWWT